MKFEKWQALGNDYLIIKGEELPVPLAPEVIRTLCDRHFGPGGDGVVLVAPSSEEAVVADLRIFNPDGSEAELSGNGVREAVLFLRRSGWTDRDSFTVMTLAGPVHPRILGDGRCSVDMGKACTTSDDYPSGEPEGLGELSAAGREWGFRHISIGNPQCAIEVGQELESLDLDLVGPDIENHEAFPNRTNVSFFRVSGNRVRARIFERGVGETLSSGTGATGAAVAAHLGGAPSDLVVELDGGELEVQLGPDLEVTLTGSAEPVYSGIASPELVRRLSEASK